MNINVVMDSSVYLTPEAFLNNYYGNWGPERIMKKIRFNFNKVGHVLCDLCVCVWYSKSAMMYSHTMLFICVDFFM